MYNILLCGITYDSKLQMFHADTIIDNTKGVLNLLQTVKKLGDRINI